MSKIVNYSMANRGRIARFLPGRDLTADDIRRADSTAEWAGNASYTALQIVIDHNGSDMSTLASCRSPITVITTLDDKLSAAGVAADLPPSQ
ncbi:hypothetical protein ACIQVN_02825 [Streptomyces cyaneofuscatus]|uniref:DUF7691 family protein n=1 Tax=Streptomyces cyaneofuscatus TaxID=66883 RepID=UPI0038139871